MRRQFFMISAIVFALIGVATYFWAFSAFALVIIGPLFALGLQNAMQTKKAILRNFQKCRYSAV